MNLQHFLDLILKYPSLLQFEHSQEDEKVRHNLKMLYGVDQVPSDTYMRERLDPLDPERLQPAFKACFSAVQRGKVLPLYSFLDDYYLVSNDGTGMFYSENVHCENCCVKKHRKGSESYYHTSGSVSIRGSLTPCELRVLRRSIFHHQKTAPLESPMIHGGLLLPGIYF